MDRPNISVKSAASVSNISECWTVTDEITHHTRNTSAPTVTRDSTIHLIWNDMFALTRVWYLEHLFIKQKKPKKWNVHEQFNYFNLGVKPYKCDFCEKSFTQRCSLESHQDKIHGVKCTMPYKKRREKIYVCEECGYSTGDVRLVVHSFLIILARNWTEEPSITLLNTFYVMSWVHLNWWNLKPSLYWYKSLNLKHKKIIKLNISI